MSGIAITRRSVLGTIGAAAAAAAAPITAKGQGRPSGRPNILFILADDMGFADLGCYDSRHISTPELDLLAAQGVRMTDAYANSPVCSPTRLALATGRYNRAFPTGLVEPFSPGEWGETAIPEGYDTWMRVLQNAGYRTSLVGKWHLGPTEKGSPLNYGYSDFFGFLGGGIDYFTHEYFGEPALMEGLEPVEREGYMTTLLADEAIARIRENAANETPFAISLHFNAPHWPWEGPEDFALGSQSIHNDGGSLEIYATMMESMDRNIGRVLRELDNLGLADDTLVIFTSDNGGERYSDVWPFRGTKGYLLEGGIRVPTILRFPNRLPAGRDSDQVALTMDFFPTMLEAAGVDYGHLALDGISLLTPLKQGRSEDRSVFWSFQGHDQAAARKDNWKYFSLEGNEFLFDISADPHERANRKDAEPQIFEALREEWNHWDANMAPRDGMPGYCGDPAGQALELPRGDNSNCKDYSTPRPVD
jgi:arylsulfatase A-like enzyme